jgi:methylmalonyl-CoA mutase
MDKLNSPMFSEFKKSSKEDWIKNATSDLKGVDVFSKYRWASDGISIDPYYDLSDLDKIKNHELFENLLLNEDDPSGEPRVWNNIQKIVVTNFASANTKAIDALNNGADGIEFDLDLIENGEIKILLADIQLNYCAISITNAPPQILQDYIKYLTNNGDPSLVSGQIIGINNVKYQIESDELIQIINSTAQFPKIKCIEISDENEESVSDQIVKILTSTNRQIRSLLLHGIDITTIAKSLSYSTKIGTDFFVEIAKVKSIRNLLFQIYRAYGHEQYQPADIDVKCISNVWINEKYQPHGNMLKGSTAAMSAILGGCNTLIVEPEERDNSQSTRIARNISNILREESYLSKTADPAAGSYYIESLTDKISQHSWQVFQKELLDSTIEK